MAHHRHWHRNGKRWAEAHPTGYSELQVASMGIPGLDIEQCRARLLGPCAQGTRMPCASMGSVGTGFRSVARDIAGSRPRHSRMSRPSLHLLAREYRKCRARHSPWSRVGIRGFVAGVEHGLRLYRSPPLTLGLAVSQQRPHRLPASCLATCPRAGPSPMENDRRYWVSQARVRTDLRRWSRGTWKKRPRSCYGKAN